MEQFLKFHFQMCFYSYRFANILVTDFIFHRKKLILFIHLKKFQPDSYVLIFSNAGQGNRLTVVLSLMSETLSHSKDTDAVKYKVGLQRFRANRVCHLCGASIYSSTLQTMASFFNFIVNIKWYIYPLIYYHSCVSYCSKIFQA